MTDDPLLLSLEVLWPEDSRATLQRPDEFSLSRTLSGYRKHSQLEIQPNTGLSIFEDSPSDRANLVGREVHSICKFHIEANRDTLIYSVPGAGKTTLHIHRADLRTLQRVYRIIARANQNSAIPKHRPRQAAALRNILTRIDDVTSAETLAAWLLLVLNHGISPEPGTLPETPALELFKRLLHLNGVTAIRYLDNLLTSKPHKSFRDGYLQLSLIAALASFATNEENDSSFLTPTWVQHAMGSLQSNTSRFTDHEMKVSLLASLTALNILVLPDTEEAALSIQDTIQHCLRAAAEGDKQLFLQFLADTLGEFIPMDQVKQHLTKLLLLSRFIHATAVLWPSTYFVGVMSLLRDLVAGVASTRETPTYHSTS